MIRLRIIREYSYFDFVPKEIINYITDFLDDFNVMVFTSVCKRFYIKDKREKSKNCLWEERRTIVWNVPEDVIGAEDSCMPTEIGLKIVLDYLRHVKYDLKRGDLIHLDSAGEYRNDGICIFDGDRIVNLASEIDDGHIPASFPVITEFPLQYWNKDIQHNFLVAISEELNSEIIKNLSIIEITIQVLKNHLTGKTPYSFVKMHDKFFHFLFVRPDDICSTGVFLAPTLDETIKQINDCQYYNLYDELLDDEYNITSPGYVFNTTNTLVVKMDQNTGRFGSSKGNCTFMTDFIYVKTKDQPVMILPKTESNKMLAYTTIMN